MLIIKAYLAFVSGDQCWIADAPPEFRNLALQLDALTAELMLANESGYCYTFICLRKLYIIYYKI